jgi:hypothetical protein
LSLYHVKREPDATTIVPDVLNLSQSFYVKEASGGGLIPLEGSALVEWGEEYIQADVERLVALTCGLIHSAQCRANNYGMWRSTMSTQAMVLLDTPTMQLLHACYSSASPPSLPPPGDIQHHWQRVLGYMNYYATAGDARIVRDLEQGHLGWSLKPAPPDAVMHTHGVFLRQLHDPVLQWE